MSANAATEQLYHCNETILGPGLFCAACACVALVTVCTSSTVYFYWLQLYDVMKLHYAFLKVNTNTFLYTSLGVNETIRDGFLYNTYTIC